ARTCQGSSAAQSTLLLRLRHRLEQLVHLVLEAAVARAQQDAARRVALAGARQAQRAVDARLAAQQPAVALRLERFEQLLRLGRAAPAVGGHRLVELRRERQVLSRREVLRQESGRRRQRRAVDGLAVPGRARHGLLDVLARKRREGGRQLLAERRLHDG